MEQENQVIILEDIINKQNEVINKLQKNNNILVIRLNSVEQKYLLINDKVEELVKIMNEYNIEYEGMSRK